MFGSKSELFSPPVAPVGSLHASRHQATVMERAGVGETDQRRKKERRLRPQEEITVLLKSVRKERSIQNK